MEFEAFKAAVRECPHTSRRKDLGVQFYPVRDDLCVVMFHFDDAKGAWRGSVPVEMHERRVLTPLKEVLEAIIKCAKRATLV